MLAAVVAMTQPANYDDVAVIMNVNSPASQLITAAFQVARGIPQVNIIPVNVPVTEQIAPADFHSLRAQIEAHMTTWGLVESINYIVTTKGVPLRIGTTTCDSINNFNGCTAVDSELTLLFSPWSAHIQTNILTPNPFLGSHTHHSRETHGIYLVTRLDGFKEEDVTNLIERSAQEIPVDKTGVLFAGDFHWPDAMQGVPAIFDNYLGMVMAPLANAGWQTIIDMSDTVLSPLDHVLGHIALHHLPETGLPEIAWAPGGLAMDWMNMSAASFDPMNPDPDKVRIADRIVEGAFGARGHVTLSFASLLSYSHYTFARYTDTTLQFNLAESFYAGIPVLSEGILVIGDPKTSIRIQDPTGITNHTSSTMVSAHPNPSDGHFTVRVAPGHAHLASITDAVGRVIPHVPSGKRDQVEIDLAGQPAGIYFARLLDEQDRLVVVRLVVCR